MVCLKSNCSKRPSWDENASMDDSQMDSSPQGSFRLLVACIVKDTNSHTIPHKMETGWHRGQNANV